VGAGWWVFSISRPDNAAQPGAFENRETLVAPAPAQAPAEVERPMEQDVAATEKETTRETTKRPADVPLTPKTEIVAVKPDEKAQPTGTEKAASPALPELTQQKAIPSSAAEQRMKIDTNMATRRMMPAAIQADVAGTLRFQPVDTTRVSPAQGWTQYFNFLSRSIKPSLLDKPAILTIYTSTTGSVETVDIAGDHTEAEKIAITQIIKNGPAWKNKTDQAATAIIKW
ncbi:MAG TPA: hypothetical protein VK907_09895, partial [Phnomibacter sp.]|nr:hypothetical protein [Phnomibacter sp.]